MWYCHAQLHLLLGKEFQNKGSNDNQSTIWLMLLIPFLTVEDDGRWKILKQEQDEKSEFRISLLFPGLANYIWETFPPSSANGVEAGTGLRWIFDVFYDLLWHKMVFFETWSCFVWMFLGPSFRYLDFLEKWCSLKPSGSSDLPELRKSWKVDEVHQRKGDTLLHLLGRPTGKGGMKGMGLLGPAGATFFLFFFFF